MNDLEKEKKILQKEINPKDNLQNMNDEEIWSKLQFVEFSKEESEWNDKFLDKKITELLENADLLGLNGEEQKEQKQKQNKKVAIEKKSDVQKITQIKNDDLLSLKESEKGNTKGECNLMDIDFFYEETKKN